MKCIVRTLKMEYLSYFLGVTLVIFEIFPVMAHEAPPKFEIVDNNSSRSLKQIQDPFRNETIYYTTDRYSDFGPLILRCEAYYPIMWTFKGYHSKLQTIDIGSPNYNITNKLCKISLTIEKTYFSYGMQVLCQKIGDTTMSGGAQFFKSWYHNPLKPSKNTSVFNSKLIPCPTTNANPTDRVSLHRLNADDFETTINSEFLRYDPLEGFKSEDEFNGTYICRQRGVSVTVTAVLTEPLFSPYEDQVRAFPEDTLTFKCFSRHEVNAYKLLFATYDYKYKLSYNWRINYFEANKSQPADVGFNSTRTSYKHPRDSKYFERFVYNGNRTIEFSDIIRGAEIYDHALYHKLYDYDSTLYYPRTNDGKIATVVSKEVDRLSAFCVENVKGNYSTIKVWELQTVKIPTFEINNKKRRLICHRYGDVQGRIETIQCQNNNHCNIVSTCFDHGNCVGSRNYQRVREDDSWLPFSFYSGVVQCEKILRDSQMHPKDKILSKRWTYFTSLEYVKYLDWRQVPTYELVKILPMPSVLYENETTRFVCMAVAFHFADSISFEIEFKNESRQFLEHNNDSILISNGHNHSRKVDELNILGVLDVRLELNTVAMHCLVPWANSTDVMVTSVTFETRRFFVPQFKETASSPVQEYLYYGETDRRLKCLAFGEPEPVYVWSFNDTIIPNVNLPQLKVSQGCDKGSYLEFSQVNENSAQFLKGKYTCIASNRFGNATRKFQIDFLDKTSNLTTITVAVAGIVFGFGAIAFLLVLRKYKRAKKGIRDLSETEIVEFFQGKPELLQRLAGSSLDAIDYLPYNESLEIPLNDLHFVFSDDNLLGSGEFSFVVRGLILSLGKPIALKISKPSTDVTLFKSLLSEVKIMSHIGKHENVMELVGVCTQDIKSRIVYIATDICDRGSLNNLLRKSKSLFVNLCNANQELDMCLLPKMDPSSTNQEQMTTLDLINYALQIAKGMEYLAFKCVVHADLATRNVLVTSDNTAKISDFGLSRKLYENNHYVKKTRAPLPWRWMAPESLSTLTFSTPSDVWAYGVTLYEIFTLGDAPYPNESWNHDFVQRLRDGMRMGRPKYSPPEIYFKMMACWEDEPNMRPEFASLRSFFQNLYCKLVPSSPANEDIPNSFHDNVPSTQNNYYLDLEQAKSSKPLGVDEAFSLDSVELLTAKCVSVPNNDADTVENTNIMAKNA